jgi:uncharacterized protein (DUF736 family)
MKMAILTKAMYMFNSIKTLKTFSTKIEESILKFIWNHNRSLTAKANLIKKSNAGFITIPDFKLYYIAIVIKTTWNWQKSRQEYQWKRVEDPDINLHSYSNLIFKKETKHGAKNSLLNKW